MLFVSIATMSVINARAVAARLIILSELCNHMFAGLDDTAEDDLMEAHLARLKDLKSNGLWEYATTREKSLFEIVNLGSDFAAEAYFCVNAQGVLAWCLNLIGGMPPFDVPLADPDAPYSDALLDALPLPNEFSVKNWTLRPSEEIEDARVDAELWHWRSRTLEIQRSEPITKNKRNWDSYQDRAREVALLCASEGRFVPIGDDFPALGQPFHALSDDEFARTKLIAYERHKALNWVNGMAPSDDYDQTPTDT